MQLTALTPSVVEGLYSTYSLESSPAIGVSTNDIYMWMTLSGTTSSSGEFSKATFYPSIKNNRNTTATFYWAASYSVTGLPDLVTEWPGNVDFSWGHFGTGTATVSANGTLRPQVGIVPKGVSSCASCPYTLYTTIHFSTVYNTNSRTPTAMPTVTPSPTQTVTFT